MFPLIHSVGDVYMAQYVMNVFLELTKNHIEFQKVTLRSLFLLYVHLMFTKKRKSTYKIFVSA